MKRILVIDDDPVLANSCYNQLMAEGYHVRSVPDGESGLNTMREFKPNIILLDLILPQMSGLEVIRRIRSEEEFSRIPIVVFTNAFQTNMVQDAWKAGATKCISKSNCSARELIEVVRRCIEDLRERAVVAPFGEPAVAPVVAAPEPATARRHGRGH